MAGHKETNLGRRTVSTISLKSEDGESGKFPITLHAESSYYIGIGSWTPYGSERSEESDKEVLSYLESAFMAILVEDSLDEVTILKYVIGVPIISSWDFRYKVPKERFRRRLTPQRIFPEVDSKPDLTTILKLQRDREYVEKVLRQLMKGLTEESSFLSLSMALNDLIQETNDDITLKSELKNNLSRMKELKEKLTEKRRLDDLEEKERDEFMYHLQDELDDIILKCDVEERFVKRWENNRKAQNQWKMKNAENFFKDNINKLTMKNKMEKRVTYEFQLYLKANIAELEEELEQWMALYDSEMERRENKILQLKYNRDQTEEKKFNLKKLYENRIQEMKDWVEFRETRKRRAQASLIIQSWWRGILVRKKLGPYKPKKHKK